MKWVRITCYSGIVLTFLQFVAGSSILAAYCNSAGKDLLNSTVIDACLTWDAYAILWKGVIAVVVDIILFLLPFPIIIKLQLPRRKKINLAIVMAGI